MQVYDIIGDTHGYADELHSLLETLGYRDGSRLTSHPEGRKVIFLGDYVDRGPKIREVLETVRTMVDGGMALAILGNHEINAMRFHAKGSEGEFLRPHTAKNLRQHRATLAQIPDVAEWEGWLNWFAALPLSLDFGNLRAVHASWDDEAIAELSQIGRLEGTTLEKYSRKDTAGHATISRIVNGPEAFLPAGYKHETVDGAMRREFRVKWWLDIVGMTCREAIFPDDPTMPDLPPQNAPKTGYPTDAPPTFFGHYSRRGGTPAPIRPNLACIDYGPGKGGFLCAYRWNGEAIISPEKFVVAGKSNQGEA